MNLEENIDIKESEPHGVATPKVLPLVDGRRVLFVDKHHYRVTFANDSEESVEIWLTPKMCTEN